MMQLAACLLTERGIQVCCPIHDALLAEGAVENLEDIVRETQFAMAEASRVVLSGHALRTDAEVVTWPDRYQDARGREMWSNVMAILASKVRTSVSEPVQTAKYLDQTIVSEPLSLY